MKTIRMTIGGMSCGHCVMAVRKALSKLPATTVDNVEVGSAVVTTGDPAIDEGALAGAVEEAGYVLTGVREETAARP